MAVLCASGSVGRAQPCQGWGRGFESRLALFLFVYPGADGGDGSPVRKRLCDRPFFICPGGWREGESILSVKTSVRNLDNIILLHYNMK